MSDYPDLKFDIKTIKKNIEDINNTLQILEDRVKKLEELVNPERGKYIWLRK